MTSKFEFKASAPKVPVVTQLKNLRADIDKALAAVLANNPGLSIKTGHCSYTHGGAFTLKLEGSLPGGENKEEGAYKLLQQYNKDLPPLGTKVRISGQERTIVGGLLRGKYTILVSNADGSRTRFVEEDVARIYQSSLAAAAAAANKGGAK